MIHHDFCPVCLNTDISGFLKCKDHFISKETFEIFRCNKCGFVFTQDHPEESEAGRYYESEDYISHSDSKKGITDRLYQLVRQLMLKRKKKLIRKTTGLSAGSILDIGCGTGHFLNSMKDTGWNTTGIEINEKARKYAESRFDLDVLTPEKIKTLTAGIFDCVTLWHVLEHFQEPNKIMEEIFRLLKPDGACIIALPNNQSFDSKYYGKEWAAYDVPRHLWHFNPATFSLFVKRNKFKLMEKKTLPFDVFYISILSEKYRSLKFPFIYGAIKGLVFSVRSIFNRSGSSSMIYILKKDF
jgi:2-polyprenyl-3-methyl-5-hydroxy-6-metoxy-1,4-benzoquinol methylase